jgi:hypothetical protein
MSKASNMHTGYKCKENFNWKTQREKDHFGDLGINRTELKLILKLSLLTYLSA